SLLHRQGLVVELPGLVAAAAQGGSQQGTQEVAALRQLLAVLGLPGEFLGQLLADGDGLAVGRLRLREAVRLLPEPPQPVLAPPEVAPRGGVRLARDRLPEEGDRLAVRPLGLGVVPEDRLHVRQAAVGLARLPAQGGVVALLPYQVLVERQGLDEEA